MAQRVFTFKSPVTTSEAVDIISKTILSLNGKVKLNDNVIIAKLRSKKYWTVFPHKFTFYIGEDSVRVTTSDNYYSSIKWEYNCCRILRVWDDFIIALSQMFPHLDFGLNSGKVRIVSAKFVSDGIEHQFSSAGVMFGGISLTGGSATPSFSKEILLTVRYSNGMVLEGTVTKNSKVYNMIMTNLNRLR